MRDAEPVQRATGQRDGLRVAGRGHEDIFIGDVDLQTAILRGGSDQAFRRRHQPCHARIGQAAQGDEEVGLAGSDAEGRFADPGMGDRGQGEIGIGQGRPLAERGQRRHQGCHGGHRRDAGFGLRGMRRLSGQANPHPARRAGRGPLGQGDMAQRHAGHVVDREGEIRAQIGKGGVNRHSRRAGAVLFGRLKHQDYRATRRPGAAQQAGHRRDHRHMPVMAAQMPLARDRRAVRGLGAFLDRQGIQFAAQ